MTKPTGPILMTLGALAAAEPALTLLAQTKLPYAAAYKILRLTRAAREHLQYFAEQRDALVRDFGAPRPASPAERARGTDAEVYHVVPGSAGWPEFLAKVTELAKVEVPLAVEPFDPSTVPGLEIAAADLLALGPLLAAPE